MNRISMTEMTKMTKIQGHYIFRFQEMVKSE